MEVSPEGKSVTAEEVSNTAIAELAHLLTKQRIKAPRRGTTKPFSGGRLGKEQRRDLHLYRVAKAAKRKMREGLPTFLDILNAPTEDS